MLSLGGGKENYLVGLGVSKAQAGLAFSDEKGQCRISLGVAADGPTLHIQDKQGRQRAIIGVSTTIGADGKKATRPESSIILWNPDGTAAWSAP